MSCCGQEYSEKAVGECVECGSDVDADGDAVECCSYSPEECTKCGWRPCDQSC